MSYTHTTERYKILSWDFNGLTPEEIERIKQKVKSPWCEDTKKGIRPLVGVKVPKTGTFENEMFRKPEHTNSENRNMHIPKTGTFENEMFRKPEHAYKEYIEPFKEQSFIEPTTTEKTDVVVVEKNGHQSQFSFEDCIRYVNLCQQQGQIIKNPTGLATYLYESGEKDAFISAKLYPEPIEETHVEYDDEYKDAPQPLDEYELDEARRFLEGMLSIGKNLSEFESFYAPSDWKILTKELQK
ncbi:MAG TPA: hypothetical protein VF556_17535 [Pyrinomonadaceae bacterium]